eukprot:TRINITY_DN7236_c0_g1_i2.p2 TRINITY_DN7236_c0_g1~~TRINITY_DN7236_c0_g1_i2.p2  ORF type:complete len:118 (-),score=35.18 TRINITY_DN7236_c0_g1_i2:360-713(-)
MCIRDRYSDLFSRATGPATYYLEECPQIPLMLLSAMLCGLFGTMQMLWSLIVFEKTRCSQWPMVAGSVGSHFVASFMTLLSASASGGCIGVLVLEMGMTAGLGWVALHMRRRTPAQN